MKKRGTVYLIIISLWIGALAVLGFALFNIIKGINETNVIKYISIIILLVINTLVLGILWLGSIKDFIFSLTYAFKHKKLEKEYQKIKDVEISKENEPRVLLLYCTCNDFNPSALSKSSRQDYSNFKVVILDDSTKNEYISLINKYKFQHSNVEVVRRNDHKGYKAGNLNNYLMGRDDYDYFVVLDSDEVIPQDYIKKVLKYFNYDSNCGAVQAKHKALKGKNIFQDLMGMCVNSNGTTVQVVKNFYGANALIGHGMTISKECYIKTKGFPLVVAEDISFAVEIKNVNLNIIYAPDIECFEEFPIDYVSLKKRQCKWTQGNLEYMRKYDKDINHSKMKWFEKMDIKLSHYSLPIVPILSLLLTICTIGLGFLGYPIIRYSLTIYLIMILFLCSPMIPDLFVYQRTKNIFLLIPYFIINIMTYASLSPMMLKTIFLGLFGKKATFIVTPKDSKKFTLKEVFKYSYDSIIFALIIGALALLSCGSILPVIFIVVGCLGAPLIILLANVSLEKKVRIKEKEQKIEIIEPRKKIFNTCEIVIKR